MSSESNRTCSHRYHTDGWTFSTAYRRSLTEFTDRVAQVGPDQWDVPTPCSLWDVRTLVNHIVYEDRWSVPLVAGASLADVGDRFEGDLLGDDPLAAAAARRRTRPTGAVERAGCARRAACSCRSVRHRPRSYLRQLLADHLVHGWDLAAAIGGPRALDPDVVDEVAALVRRRGGGLPGARARSPRRAAVAPDASTQDRLIATFGRDPGWPTPG